MLVNCKSCKKKFTVPDSAITESGRLLQCGSCGDKWTQFPIKEKLVKEIEKIASNKIKQPISISKKKTSLKKKKREVNLYSEKYLKKKYGLSIKNSPNERDKKKVRSNFGFYNYLITISIFIITLFGILNISKDTITAIYPVTIPYINYLYEAIDIVRVTISKFVN